MAICFSGTPASRNAVCQPRPRQPGERRQCAVWRQHIRQAGDLSALLDQLHRHSIPARRLPRLAVQHRPPPAPWRVRAPSAFAAAGSPAAPVPTVRRAASPPGPAMLRPCCPVCRPPHCWRSHARIAESDRSCTGFWRLRATSSPTAARHQRRISSPIVTNSAVAPFTLHPKSRRKGLTASVAVGNVAPAILWRRTASTGRQLVARCRPCLLLRRPPGNCWGDEGHYPTHYSSGAR